MVLGVGRNWRTQRKHQPWLGNHYLATYSYWESNRVAAVTNVYVSTWQNIFMDQIIDIMLTSPGNERPEKPHFI